MSPVFALVAAAVCGGLFLVEMTPTRLIPRPHAPLAPKLSFRAEQVDAFSSRRSCGGSACVVEESWLALNLSSLDVIVTNQIERVAHADQLC